MTTEAEFYAAAKETANRFHLTDGQYNMLAMTCAENGYDCGAECWDVSISTLKMYEDQGQIMNAANNVAVDC